MWDSGADEGGVDHLTDQFIIAIPWAVSSCVDDSNCVDDSLLQQLPVLYTHTLPTVMKTSCSSYLTTTLTISPCSVATVSVVVVIKVFFHFRAP